MSANMYANKKYNEEIEEIISILKDLTSAI